MPPHLEGRYVASQGDSVRVAVLMEQNGYAGQRMRQEFSVSHSEVVQIQSEVFSRRRTMLLGVGVVGILAVVFNQYSATNADPGNSNGPNPDAPAIRTIGISISR
jgi:hypothetical protein